MKETDLAERVINWLEDQHWEIYQEVQFRGYGGIADIVAVRAGYLWIIECKTSMTFTVLEQASLWHCHFRSIAIPATNRALKGRGIAYKIAKDYLKLGIIEVGDGVHEYLDAPLMREYHNYSKRMISQLCEEQKHYLKAGSNGGGYYTPYRRTMDHVKDFITSHPGCTLKEIMNDIGGEHHYASNQGARTSIGIALSNWERWCEIQNNNGALTYFIKSDNQDKR